MQVAAYAFQGCRVCFLVANTSCCVCFSELPRMLLSSKYKLPRMLFRVGAGLPRMLFSSKYKLPRMLFRGFIFFPLLPPNFSMVTIFFFRGYHIFFFRGYHLAPLVLAINRLPPCWTSKERRQYKCKIKSKHCCLRRVFGCCHERLCIPTICAPL